MIDEKMRYREAIQKAFDQWSEQYEKEVVPKLKNRGYSYKQLAELILREGNYKKGLQLLELGTGTGVLGKEVYQISNADLVGFDISEGMLQEAAKKNVYQKLVSGDSESLPFPKQSFDVIYTAFMLHSVFNQYKALSEMKRVKKEKGRIIVVDLFPINEEIAKVSQAHSVKYEYGAPSKYILTTQLETMIEKNGLQILKEGKLGEDREYIHYYYVLE